MGNFARFYSRTGANVLNLITHITIKLVSREMLYSVRLKDDERKELNQYLRRGKSSARSLTRARILLLADEGKPDAEIAETLKVSRSTANRVRKRYCEGGLDFALHEKNRSGAPPKIDGRVVAQLTLLACSDPPEVGEAGFDRLFLGGVEGEDLIDLVGVHRGGMVVGR
jgi:putative transposase